MDVLNKDCLALEVLSGVEAVELGKLFLGVEAVELGKLFLGVELLGVLVTIPGLYIADLILGVDVLNKDSIALEVLSGVEAVELGKLLQGIELLSVHVAGLEMLQTGVEVVELESDSVTPGDTITES